MTDLTGRLAALTPQQRRALALRIRERETAPPALGELSHAQERIWFLDQTDPGDPAYNLLFATRLRGPLNVPALQHALQEVIARHEALGVVFTCTAEGHPRQVRREPYAVSLTPLDVRSSPDPDAEVRRVAADLGQHRFDLSAGPLLAAKLIYVGDDEHVLLVLVHHIVFDGWSSQVFTADLAILYIRSATGEPNQLPSIARQFRQCAAEERRQLTDDVMRHELAFWRDRLAAIPEESAIPGDLPRPQQPSHTGARRTITFSAALTERLTSLARASGTTMTAVLAAATAAVLHRFGAPQDVLLGVPVAGRSSMDLEPVIGCFANTLVVRIAIDHDMTVHELIRQAHLSVSAAYAHQVPYANVVEAVAPSRDRSRNPLFQMLVSVNAFAESGERHAGGVTFSSYDVDRGHIDMDMFLNLQLVGSELAGTLDYSTDLYLPDTADDVIAALNDTLAQFADQPEGPLSAVPALRCHSVTLAATFTADPVHEPLRFWSRFLHTQLHLAAVPYGQVLQHLLSPSPSDVTVVYLRWEDWLRYRGGDQQERFLDEVCAELIEGLGTFRAASSAPLVLVLCPASGRYEALAPVFARLDDWLMYQALKVAGVHVAFAEGWAQRYAATSIADPGADELGHVPYTPDYFAAIAAGTIRWLARLLGFGWPAEGSARGDYIRGQLGTAASIRARVAPARPAATADDGPVVPPRTDTERILLGLWQDALGTEGIGVTSDFFACGGHSLLATRLVSAIRTAFGRDLSLHRFLTNPTVEANALLLAANRAAEGGTSGSSDAAGPGRVRAAVPGATVPLSSTQRRMWALYQLADAPTALHTTYAVQLTGALDQAALREALVRITARHEVLRMSFAAASGSAVGVIRDAIDPWRGTADLRETDTADRQQAVRDLLAHDAREPYRLESDPLIRARLIRVAQDTYCLVIGMHHAVCDITSWRIFLSELAMFYGATASDQDSPPPAPLPVQFADFAAWQQEWLASDLATQHIAFWRDRLAGVPAVLDLRRALPRPARRTGQASVAVRKLPAQLCDRLRETARSQGLSQFSVVLTALAICLGAESGRDDVVIGVPVHGRSQAEVESLIGYFADLLPMRVTLAGQPTVRQLLRRVRDDMAAFLSHQDIPLSTIVEAVQPARGRSHHPLFQVVLNYVEDEGTDPGLPGLTAERLPVPESGTDFDLFLTAASHPDGLTLSAAFATDILDAPAVTDLLDTFEAAVETVARLDDSITVSGVVSQGAASDLPVPVATSFPVTAACAAAERWAGRLGVPLRMCCSQAGSVFRPLLDAESGFGRDPAVPAVLFLRWEDLLGVTLMPGQASLAAVVWRAEEVLGEMIRAIGRFRARSGAPLLVLTVPPSAPWRQLETVLSGLDTRLAREATRVETVEVVLPAHWSRTQLPSDVGVIVAARILHGLGYSPRWVAVDPAGWTDFELGRLAGAQRRYGRQVVLDGGLRTGLPGVIASGELAAAGGLAIASGPDAASDLGQLLSAADVLVIDGGAASQHSWLLDPPLGTAEPRPWTDFTGPASQVAQPGTGQPQTNAERALAGIWGELLHLTSVDVTEDFFALGGDSILAIEAAFLAGEAGISVTPRQIMDHLSVRELTATPTAEPDPAATAATSAAPVAEGPVTDAPLAPAQRWYLDAVATGTERPERFTHPYYLQLNRQIEPTEVLRIAAELAAAHDSLRLRLRPDDGGWRQWCAPADVPIPVQTIDVSDLPPGQRETAIEAAATAAQSSLSFDGPLVRLLHLRSGPAEGDRLLFVAHHLVTDGISRRILLEDLDALLLGLPRTSSPFRPAMSYLQWANEVYEFAQSVRLRSELPFWLEQRPASRPAIPMDLAGPFTFGTLREENFALTEPETTGLLGQARRMGLKVNDLLVWALTSFLADWTGQRECALALSGHGRDPLSQATNVSATTGWFQIYYPLRISLPVEHRDPRAAAGVARQLALVPGTGLGWGALRYLCADPAVQDQLTRIQLPRVSFNYTGHFGPAQAARPNAAFTVCTMPYGLEQEATAVAPFDLHFSASITGPRLQFLGQYSLNCHRPETARWILSAVRDRLLSAVAVSEVTTRQGIGAFDAET